MKKINNLKRGGLIALAALTLTVSCKDSFLEVLPTGSLGEAQLSTKDGLEGLLVGAYSMLNGKNYSRAAGPNNWVGSMLGGDSNKGTDPGDFTSMNPVQRYEVDPTNGDINSLWQSKFEGISRSNNVIRMAAASDKINDATRTRIIAEARVLRGHYYFHLKTMFNSAPYFDETVEPSAVVDIPNTPELWDKIEADFKFGMDNLPNTQADAGRVNKWAAAAYYGKTLLYQKKYGAAKAVFDDVIANGQTTNGKKYALREKYADIFNAAFDNHEESVFAVQAANNTGSTNNANWFDDLNYPYNTGTNGPGNCCGFNQPTFTLANMFRTKDGLPLLDNSFNNPTNVVKNDYEVEANVAFTEDAGPLDPRIDHTIGRRGIPYLDWQEHPGKAWIRAQSYAGPYSPKKYVYYKTQENSLTDGSSWTRGYATMNFTIIRFADVLLMAAESEIEAGTLARAKELINMVRGRAANPAGWVMEYDGSKPAANYDIKLYDDFASKDDAWKALKFERVLEFAQEGNRFNDLMRWGDAASFINNIYLPYDSKFLVTKFGGAKFTTGKNEYLPIPQAQIDIQPALKQNPGY